MYPLSLFELYSKGKKMADKENPENQGQNGPAEGDAQAPAGKNDSVEEIVERTVADRLKDFKDKVDKAYKQRDEALSKIAELERKEREREVAALKEQGRHQEAFEKQLAEERAAREALERKNVELTRDIEVRGALQGLPFRNENALTLAFKEVVGQLVKNENGDWVHKSGVSIRDYVKAFSDSEDNSFLFKAKASSGGGSGSGKPPSDMSGGKRSLFEMPQAEVLKLAEEGKLPGRKQ